MESERLPRGADPKTHYKLGLGGLSKARLKSLQLDAEKGALRASFDGIAERATSSSGEFATDHRLTVFDTFRYGRQWKLLAVVGAWLVSMGWAGLEVWKKLRK